MILINIAHALRYDEQQNAHTALCAPCQLVKLTQQRERARERECERAHKQAPKATWKWRLCVCVCVFVCGGAKRENGNVTCRRISDSINTLTITRTFCCIALYFIWRRRPLSLSRSKQAPTRMHRIVLWVGKGRRNVIRSHRNNNNTWHGTVFVVV